MGFVNGMNQSVANCRIGIRIKKWWLSSFVWIVDDALQNAWERYHVKKDEGDGSLPFLVFRKYNVNAIFLKYSKTGRLSSSHVRIQNIPSDTCYDDTKYYQVQSEHRRIQNPFKHLRWSVFALTVNTLKSLTGYPKTIHLKCLKMFWIRLCWSQVCKKNSQRRYAKCKSTWYVFWNILMTLANVWLTAECKFQKFMN